MGTTNPNIPIADIPKKEVYYFKQFRRAYTIDPLETYNVKLEPSILNIYSYKNIRIQLIYYEDSTKTIQKSAGETDSGSFNSEAKIITYERFFLMEYHFEKEMPIEFRIFGDINATIHTSLPSIMGSRGLKFEKQITGTDIKLQIKGFSFQNKIYTNLKLDFEINGKLSEKAIKYCLIAKGTEEDPKNRKLYLSELQVGQKKANKINFKQSVIPDICVCSDENYKANRLCIELQDAQRNKNIGEHTCCLSSLILNKYTVKFDNSISGTLFIDPIKNYSFIDYLRGGLQIKLSIAIDFTASNLPPDDPKSLHYLSSFQNQYEMAIKSCGDIVANYDNSNMFETYGFGGKFYGRQNVDFCYPLSESEDNPEIFGIDGILKKYREALSKSKLFGPTFFHYFIEKMNNKAKKQIESEDFNTYHILMILTDGIIEDTDETIDALVEASFLPISVIIIGIGNADFENMNILDADDQPLYDNKNRKASRDLVQFVPFNDFKNNPAKLAEEVLEEIPRQIVEYYQHQKISPKEPVVNINVKASSLIN
jgi:hypothetical protein